MNTVYPNRVKFFFLAMCCWLSAIGTSNAQVTANFSATPKTGCAPLNVHFTDQSTGGPTSYSWTLPGGNPTTSTQQSPWSSYLVPGVYSVTLTVTNGTSTNTLVQPNYIIVYNPPQANFTMSADTVCVGKTVTFTDATSISPSGAPIGTWLWDFHDGTTLNTSTSPVTHSFSTPGTYPVSVLVTDTNGCGGSQMVKNIVIVPFPTPSFSATPTFACTPPLNVSFTNTSSYIGNTTFFWNFGDGNTSTVKNPTNTYTSSGTFNVTLVINQDGCTDSLRMNNLISIKNIAASFAATPTVICTGQSVAFTNTSVPAASTSNWNFGDGATSTAISPSHTYSTSGTYTVNLSAGDANGCTNNTSGVVLVNQTPLANFSADTTIACSVPFTVNFTNSSTGATNYFWNFGDGSAVSTLPSPSHTYTAIGTYSVSLIATNSGGPCSDTLVKTSYIKIAPPLAFFKHLPDSGCAPLTVNFTDSSSSPLNPVSTYSWSFGDGSTSTAINPSHTYTATGVYSVTLIIHTIGGCVDTFTCSKCIKAGTHPVANYGILKDTVCFGLPVNFSDSSTGATGWNWSFGDGGHSTAQNPIYVYGDTGTYSVTLVAYDHGCTDTSNKKKVVILPPKAQFTYTLSCKNYYTVEFINTSKGADSVVWLFGDGKKDSLNKDTIFHTYPSRGPFTASLTAYNYSSGCNNTFTGTFTIAEPIASFTVTNASGCYPFATTFTSTSQDANSVFWNFGDPASTTDTSNVVNPSYTYNTPAAYSASLIITDVNGCKDTVKHTMKALGPIPYFYATKLTGCRPLTVTFRDTSHDDSTKVQWAWNFGDGTPVVVTNTDTVTHIYTVPGNYNVTDSVRDKNGCVKGLTISNYIKPTFPFPKFTVDTFSCKNNLLTFYDSTVAVGGHYLWHFGDGGTSNLQSPTHAYTSDGLYIVLLTVTDTNSCRDSIQDTIRILKPTANFSFTIGSVNCGNMLVNFTDQSSGFVNGWNWDFGNGGTSTAQNPTASYTSGGIYNVTLIVTNRGGCKDTLKLDSLVVVPFPVGTFSFFPQTGCTPLNVQFASSSMNTISYGWNFGDGTFVTNGNTISHLYTNPGTFSPLLFLQDTLPNGMPCVKTVLAPYPVIVTNVINVSLSGPNVVTVPKDSILSVNANYSGGAPPYTFSWTPDTAINCNTCPSIMIVGTGDTIVYTFTIIDKNGCLGKDSIIVLSEPCSEKKLIPNVFTPNGDGKNDMFYIPGVCPGEKYSLQIFDRWGTLMFSTTLRNNGWDGRNTSGVEASNGTYYYVVKIDNSNGQNASTITEGPIAYPSYTVTHKDGVEIIKGFVELLR